MTEPRDLGHGLILRRCGPEDIDAMVAFNGDVFRDDGFTEPDRPIALWTRDLMDGSHPTTSARDFTIVEHNGRIVSTLNLISQTWRYAGIPFGVGQVELVATHADYRRRGLIRAQMDVVHEWSRQRGELVQGIGGIPWYYRQFGYEYALPMGGARTVYPGQIPKLDAGATEPFHLRHATEADLPLLVELDELGCRRYLVSTPHDAALWRFHFQVQTPGSVPYHQVAIVETAGGEAVGLVLHTDRLRDDGRLFADRFELRAGVPWSAALPSVLRALSARGAALPPARTGASFAYLRLELGTEHPAYSALPETSGTTRPYAWYIRVPDVAAFARHVAPAIEARLTESSSAGYSGEVALSFYRSGLRLTFERGHLTAAENIAAPEKAAASFPDLTFLNLLFCHRSLADLRDSYPDCGVRSPEVAALLSGLFPKQPSSIWPLE